MKEGNKEARVGIGVIVVKEKSVLLGKRKGAHGSGEWAFPGGHLEYLETPSICAYRELLEETGLKAHSLSEGPWVNAIIDHDKHYVTLFMIVKKFSGSPAVLEPHKCEGWEWFDWEHLPQPLFSPLVFLLEKMDKDYLKKMIF